MISLTLRCHAECRVEEENWAGLSSAAKRRKLQNRLNQRAFRRRKAAQARAKQISRGGSADSVSASTISSQQFAKFEKPPRQEPDSLVDRGMPDAFDPTWDQFSLTSMASDPWTPLCADYWEPMTREADQYAIDTMSSDCRGVMSREEGGAFQGYSCDAKQEILHDQPQYNQVCSEEMSSSLWLDDICDEGWLELWSMAASEDQ